MQGRKKPKLSPRNASGQEKNFRLTPGRRKLDSINLEGSDLQLQGILVLLRVLHCLKMENRAPWAPADNLSENICIVWSGRNSIKRSNDEEKPTRFSNIYLCSRTFNIFTPISNLPVDQRKIPIASKTIEKRRFIQIRGKTKIFWGQKNGLGKKIYPGKNQLYRLSPVFGIWHLGVCWRKSEHKSRMDRGRVIFNPATLGFLTAVDNHTYVLCKTLTILHCNTKRLRVMGKTKRF